MRRLTLRRLWGFLQSIRGVSFLLIGFLVLLGLATFLISWDVMRGQEDDPVLVNLAGRQRMLSQEVAKEVAVLVSSEPTPARQSHLAETIAELEHGLRVLREGGRTAHAGREVSVRAASDAGLQALLAQAWSTWQGMRDSLNAAMEAQPGSADFAGSLSDLDRQSSVLLGQVDAITLRYQELAEARVARMRMVHLAGLGLSVGLLVLGLWLVIRGVLRPLGALERSARTLRGGDLDVPVPRVSRNELGELAATLEGMRSSLRSRVAQLESLVAAARTLVTEEPSRGRMSEVLAQLRRATDADACVLRRPDDSGELRMAEADISDEGLKPPIVRLAEGSGGLARRAYQEARPVTAGDYPSSPDADPELVAQGVKSVVGLPIVVNGSTEGVITLVSFSPDHFTPERADLASAFASNLGALIDTVRLSGALDAELRRSRERLAALREASSRLLLEEDPDLVLNHLAGTARALVDARYAALALWGPGGEMRQWIVSGLSPDEQREIGDPPAGLGVLGVVCDEGRSLRLRDVADHPKFHGFPPNHPRMRSFLGVPITVPGALGGVGAFYVTEKRGAQEFTEDDERLLGLLCSQAGVLLRNLDLLFRTVSRQERALAAIVNSMTEGLVVIDAGGRIQEWNSAVAGWSGLGAEEVKGRRLEEVMRRKAADLENPESLERARDAISRAHEGPRSFWIMVARPERRELQVTAFPIRLGDEQPLTGLIVRDATEQRALERRRDAFVQVASHELRTPMTTLLGYSELLLRRDIPEERRQRWLERIHGDTARLATIVDDMLNVSRIQSGELPVDLAWVEAPAVIERVIEAVRETSDKHRFEMDIAKHLPQAWADEAKTGQVLINLVDNAIKYSPEGGTVKASARVDRERGKIVVSVSDEGIGLAPDHRERLFTTFDRSPRPEVQRVRGSGLGLYITRELVEMMGGEIWVESELDRGSTFFFSLPDGPREGGG